jgi:hypothetical protein
LLKAATVKKSRQQRHQLSESPAEGAPLRADEQPEHADQQSETSDDEQSVMFEEGTSKRKAIVLWFEGNSMLLVKANIFTFRVPLYQKQGSKVNDVLDMRKIQKRLSGQSSNVSRQLHSRPDSADTKSRGTQSSSKHQRKGGDFTHFQSLIF